MKCEICKEKANIGRTIECKKCGYSIKLNKQMLSLFAITILMWISPIVNFYFFIRVGNMMNLLMGVYLSIFCYLSTRLFILNIKRHFNTIGEIHEIKKEHQKFLKEITEETNNFKKRVMMQLDSVNPTNNLN